MGTSTPARRWDGRTWTARSTMAVTTVLATVFLPELREHLPSIAVTAALWIPLISITQRVRLRFPGPVSVSSALLADLLVLLVLERLAPPLAPMLLVLAAAAGLLHAIDLPRQVRVLAALLVVVAQLLIGHDVTSGAVIMAVWTLDTAIVLLAALLLGERDRTRERSLAALDRADQLTDAVLAGIGEAVVVTDNRGTITATNEAAGVTFGQTVIGPCATALGLHEGPGQLDCSQGCPLLDDEQGVGQADLSRDHPSGRRQALLANVRAVRDPLGRVREVVHSFRDVTSLKQAEQAKTLFLATASHELKTPLAVIAGFVELLAEDDLDDQHRQHAIDTIRTRSRQLSGIIDRLLMASRIEGGGLRLSTQPTEVEAIVIERVSALREVTGRELVLEVNRPDDLDGIPLVAGDETAVATVIDHLVENAVKYSPDGGPVTVTVHVTAGDVHVDVDDRGVGMAATDAEHCFEAFWQAETSDTRRFGGSGIGLYIVRSLSRAMGGDTTLERAVPGDGTTFRLRLRRADIAPPPETRDESGPVTMIDEFMRQVGVGGV